MRTLKKTLCLVLALVLVLGVATIGASAAAVTDYDDFTDVDAIKYTEAVEVMNALGIVQGRDTGAFDPTAIVNRAEAAKIVAYMILGETAADLLVAAQDPFPDVDKDAWFAGYVAFVAEQGIVDGRDDGTFDPAAPVTAYEFAKMLLIACGYGAQDEFIGVNWAVNVAKLAINKGVFDGNLAADFAVGATREEATLYAFNALTQVGTVAYVPILGDYVYNDTIKLIVSGAQLDTNENSTLGWEYYNLFNVFGTVNYDPDVVKGMVIEGLFGDVALTGTDVDVFDSGYEGYIWAVLDVALTGTKAVNIADFYCTDTVVSTTYNYKAAPGFTAEETWYNGDPAEDADTIKKGSEVTVLKEIDGDDKLIVIDPWVDAVDDKLTITTPNSGSDKGKTFVTIPGIFDERIETKYVVGYENLKKGSVVTVADMDNGVYYIEELTAIPGTLTKQTRIDMTKIASADNISIYFEGNDYTKSGLDNTTTAVAGRDVDLFAWLTTDLPVKNVAIYLDRGGYVVWAADTTPAPAVGSYAVVLDTGFDFDGTLNGAGWTFQAEVVNTKGEVVVIDTDENYFRYINEWVYLTLNKDGTYKAVDAGDMVPAANIVNGKPDVARDKVVDDDTIYILQKGNEKAGYTYEAVVGYNNIADQFAWFVDYVYNTKAVDAKDSNTDLDLVYIPASITGSAISFLVLDTTPVSHETIEVTLADGSTQDVDVVGVKVWTDGAEDIVYVAESFFYQTAPFTFAEGLYYENVTVNQYGFIHNDWMLPYGYDFNDNFAAWINVLKVDEKFNNTVTATGLFGDYELNLKDAVVYTYDVFTKTVAAADASALKANAYFVCDDYAAPELIFVYIDTEVL